MLQSPPAYLWQKAAAKVEIPSHNEQEQTLHVEYLPLLGVQILQRALVIEENQLLNKSKLRAPVFILLRRHVNHTQDLIWIFKCKPRAKSKKLFVFFVDGIRPVTQWGWPVPLIGLNFKRKGFKCSFSGNGKLRKTRRNYRDETLKRRAKWIIY